MFRLDRASKTGRLAAPFARTLTNRWQIVKRFVVYFVAVLAASCFVGRAEGQTHLHYDFGGVSTRAGNVWLHTRRDGTVTTSIRVGKKVFHNSNRGTSGISYDYNGGRLDVFNNARSGLSHSWYTPRHRPAVASPQRRLYSSPFLNPLTRWYPGLR